jgi:hypothetical protein
MSEQEMSENETMWAEEQGEVDNAPAADPSLRNVGISPGGIASDLDNVAPPPEGEAVSGEAPGATQGMSPIGGPQPGAGAPASAAPMI